MAPIRNWLSRGVLTASVAAVSLSGMGIVAPAAAQSLKSVQASSRPLTLKSRGSFFVGGDKVENSAADVGIGPADSVTVNQMYVEFMVPTGRAKIPFILVHGAGLSGKSYDTTPDGRMGWFEYFVRKSYPTYVVDQVGRARSGFNIATLNRRIAGDTTPGGIPNAPSTVFRFGSRNGVWTNFRFGPRFGEAFPGEQFPTEAVDELAKQAIPDLSSTIPAPNPTFKNLGELAADLGGAVLVGHSQSGIFPEETALVNATGLRALVSLEPGACRPTFTDQDIAKLAKVPTLILFGDNLPVDTGMGSPLTWQARFEGCQAYAARVKAAGGKIEVVRTTDLGMRGNSHMLMQDRNSNQIADYVMKWVDTNALKR